METVISWIEINKEWLFSGIVGSALTVLCTILLAGPVAKIIIKAYNSTKVSQKSSLTLLNSHNPTINVNQFVGTNKDKSAKNEDYQGVSPEYMTREIPATTERECVEIRKRLIDFIKQVNENLVFGSTLTITKCAELIKDQDVYSLFDYEKVPSYELLNKFADYFCLNSNWLKYGEGSPFGDWFNSKTIIDNPSSSFNPDAIVAKIEELDSKGVYFVLVDDGMKKAYIIVKISDFQFKRVGHYAPVDVDQSGDGGKHQLRNFVRICNHFYNHSRIGAYSIDLSRSKDVANGFRDGILWPGFIENQFDTHSYWADDICDYNCINAVTDSYEELYGEWFLRTRKYLQENM